MLNDEINLWIPGKDLNKDVEQLLLMAKDVISTPEAWTRGAFARDKFGDQTGSDYDDAECWCGVGALSRCYVSLECRLNDADYPWVQAYNLAQHALNAAAQSRGYASFPHFNDDPDPTPDDDCSMGYFGATRLIAQARAVVGLQHSTGEAEVPKELVP